MCPSPHPVIRPLPSNGQSLILYWEQLHSAEPWPKIPTGLTFSMTLCLILLGLQVLGYPTLWHFSPFITNPLKTLKSKDQVCLSWGLMTERKKMKEVVGGQEDSGTRKSLAGLQPPCQFGSLNCTILSKCLSFLWGSEYLYAIKICMLKF